jgi:hypothetical protein
MVKRILPFAVLVMILAAGCTLLPIPNPTVGLRAGGKSYEDPAVQSVSSIEAYSEIRFFNFLDAGLGVMYNKGSELSGITTTLYALASYDVSMVTLRGGIGMSYEDMQAVGDGTVDPKATSSLELRVSAMMSLGPLKPEVGFIRGMSDSEVSGATVDMNPTTFYVGLGFGF